LNHKKHKKPQKERLIKQAKCNCKISNNLFLSQQTEKSDEIALKTQISC